MHEWRVTQLKRLGVPGPLAGADADNVDWHQYLRAERPDYAYLKEVFRHLREELDIEVTRAPKKLPYVPSEAEIRAFYDADWKPAGRAMSS